MNTKYVPKTPAQYCNKSQAHSARFNRISELIRWRNQPLAASGWLAAIREVMERYGLRVSEALSINGLNISKNGFIFIKGKKRSHDRIIQVVHNISFYNSFAGKNVLVFDGISRFTVYREFLKRNWTYSPPGAVRLAVTHSFRHKIIDELRSITKSDTDVKHFTGQKSESSVAQYGSKRNKKNRNI